MHFGKEIKQKKNRKKLTFNKLFLNYSEQKKKWDHYRNKKRKKKKKIISV